MDQKRLLAAIAISIGILLVFDVYNRANRPDIVAPAPQASAPASPAGVPQPGCRAASPPVACSSIC